MTIYSEYLIEVISDYSDKRRNFTIALGRRKKVFESVRRGRWAGDVEYYSQIHRSCVTCRISVVRLRKKKVRRDLWASHGRTKVICIALRPVAWKERNSARNWLAALFLLVHSHQGRMDIAKIAKFVKLPEDTRKGVEDIVNYEHQKLTVRN